jgi:hypothetical protein
LERTWHVVRLEDAVPHDVANYPCSPSWCTPSDLTSRRIANLKQLTSCKGKAALSSRVEGDSATR